MSHRDSLTTAAPKAVFLAAGSVLVLLFIHHNRLSPPSVPAALSPTDAKDTSNDGHFWLPGR